MYDNNLFIGLLIFATVLAVVGLVLVFLQKKGIVWAVLYGAIFIVAYILIQVLVK